MWSVLVVATLASWAFAAAREPQQTAAMSAIVLSIAFAKATVIGWRFMELRNAPALLRLLFAGWSGCTAIAVIAVNVW
jgi:hypothetical protein